MSTVLVDREEIEAVRNTLANGGQAVSVLRWAENILAQPAEAEGVERWNSVKLAAEVAEEDGPWDPRVGLTDCEAAFAKSASPAVVLELIAALSAVTAERDRLREEAELHDRIMSESCAKALAERDQLRAEVETWRAAARWSAVRMSGMLASAQHSMTAETTHEVLELHHHVLAGTPEKIEWLAAMAAKEE